MNTMIVATVKPVHYGYIETNKRCPDYYGVLISQVSLYDKESFGTLTKCVDYAGVLISSVVLNRIHCI